MKKGKQYTICLIAFSVLMFIIQPVLAIDYTYTTFDIPGAVKTEILGINNVGQFVGRYSKPDGWQRYGFVSDGTNYTHIEYPWGYDTNANGINDAGQIVGRSAYTGFLYNGITYTEIHFPGSFDTKAYDINNKGEIVGMYGTDDATGVNYYSFLYDGITYTKLDFGIDTIDAMGINDTGQIVGSGIPSYSGGHDSFLYDGTTYTTFAVPGATFTNAMAINNKGQIVGEYGANGVFNGFLYDGTTYTTINFPGAKFATAMGINDAGQIVGYYWDVYGDNHGFIATPTVVPEPISSILFVTGGTLLAGRRFLKRKA